LLKRWQTTKLSNSLKSKVMRSETIKIKDQPEFTAFVKTAHDFVYGYIYLDSQNTERLAIATKRMYDLGFEYDNCSHNLGYYDSVEDLTLEYSLKGRSKVSDFLKEQII
jgi:hypothetical protein